MGPKRTKRLTRKLRILSEGILRGDADAKSKTLEMIKQAARGGDKKAAAWLKARGVPVEGEGKPTKKRAGR